MRALLFTLLFPIVAMASGQHVGEFVVYKMTIAGMDGISSTMITSYNANTGFYNEKTTTTFAGRSTNENLPVLEDDVWTHEAAEGMLLHCVSEVGTIETVTYRSNLYRVCKLPITSEASRAFLKRTSYAVPMTKSTKGYLWLGNFPVNGVYKIQTDTFAMGLIDSQWKQ